MNKELMKRVIMEADYIINTKCTVRQAAKKFGLGKSTIHRDINYRLSRIDTKRYEKIRDIADKNIIERTARGGEKTRHTSMLRRLEKIS